MKKLFGCVCVCQIFLPVLLLLCTIAGVKANNIRVEGKTRVTGFTGDTAVIEVTLRWDNSWRDDFNWDAAWVFFKYKKRGLENPWQHAYLSSSGHVLNTAAGNEGGGYAYMVGANAGKVNGLYVMRNGISEGNVSVRLQAKWPLNSTGLTSADFGDALNGIYVAVHAIEMVYVPYGAYYLGDASSYKSFAVGDTAAVVIDSESALTLSAKNGMPNVSLAASYPKGYAGFYVMKYETSQEQYVEFLNSLTLEQQKARVTNNNFSTMKRGDYVFGDITQPSCRNGIVFIEQRKANTPVVFGNNLNPNNDLFSTDDGQTLACNYMSVEDMIAYCSWSGLRPMSELEYEKACRRFYPQVPDKGEYAWNTNNGVNRLNGLGDLNYRGDEREQALSYLKNVNSGTSNSINGPVRCGLFATSATNQTQAGATYWGVMEMSGNLKELCVSVGNPNFNGSSSGTGVYNPAYWNTSVGSYGVRGGGFNSADDLLRTSDRTEAMNYFTTITQRDSTVGFRGVYSLSGIEINGGEISAPETLCPGDEANILNIKAASCPDFPDMRFQYTWYVKKPGEARYEVIPNAMGENITHTHLQTIFQIHGTYQIKRNGVCAVGMTESNEISITVPNIMMDVTPLSGTIDACGNVTTFTATATGESIRSYNWSYDTKNLSTVDNYKINRGDFGNKVGTHTITCEITFNNGCVLSSPPITVHIPDIKISPNENVPVCGEYSFTDTRDGEIYCTVQVGKQCWMGRNLRYTGVSHCLVGNPVDKEKYGVHYFWKIAMNGEAASSANPSGVRGICPEGWHLPSVSEFNELIAACGGTSVAGAYMKSKMNMSLSGFGYGCRNSSLEQWGLYGSTVNDGYNNGVRLKIDKGNTASIHQYLGATSYPNSYRCLKD